MTTTCHLSVQQSHDGCFKPVDQRNDLCSVVVATDSEVKHFVAPTETDSALVDGVVTNPPEVWVVGSGGVEDVMRLAKARQEGVFAFCQPTVVNFVNPPFRNPIGGLFAGRRGLSR